MRVGLGYDVHRFEQGRPLVLGGVTIPSPEGLAGHSDADVLIHALMDALLGAAGLKDIGHLFPNTDPQYKGCSSMRLLEIVMEHIRHEKLLVGNVDISLIAEKPKIAQHIDTMKQNIALKLAVPISCVGIKATTNEKMGFIGLGEGIAAFAISLLINIP
jgi:2-C-methyl-D-erythritol 2,4-cyclodiphosphate synthase